MYGLSGMSTNFGGSAAQREESQDGEDSVMDSVRYHGRHQGAAPLAHQAESNRDGHQGRDAQPALRMDRRENEADDKHAEQDAQSIAKLGAGLAKLPIEDAAKHRLLNNRRCDAGGEEDLAPDPPVRSAQGLEDRMGWLARGPEVICRVAVLKLKLFLHQHQHERR